MRGCSRACGLVPLGSVCSHEVMGLCTRELPGQRPSWTHGSEGSEQPNSPGDQTLETSSSPSFITCTPWAPPLLGTQWMVLESWPKDT